MSLVEKVAALWRCLFGASTQPPLADAVEKMRKAMGISPTGSLPSDVDALLEATGAPVAAARMDSPVAPAQPAQ